MKETVNNVTAYINSLFFKDLVYTISVLWVNRVCLNLIGFSTKKQKH